VKHRRVGNFHAVRLVRWLPSQSPPASAFCGSPPPTATGCPLVELQMLKVTIGR
jgi:hypothetical protein